MKSNFKILAVTLARGGSKKIKKKNIREINGKPLIYYTIHEAKKCKLITDYIISTDSIKIKKTAEQYGASVPFIRPKKYSLDTSSSSSALIHALKFMEKLNSVKYDYVVELMCTNPLKNHVDISNVIKKIIRTKADTVIAMHKLEDHHPARIKKIVNDKIVDFCISEKAESRRQDLRPYAYIRSGSIYAINRDYLLRTGKRYGSINSRPYILPSIRAINIDHPIDLQYAEILLKK
tara:strand:+ start:11177 stop:11881 length:705 start_codon:yes stop_codon:yes gene_type:complete